MNSDTRQQRSHVRARQKFCGGSLPRSSDSIESIDAWDCVVLACTRRWLLSQRCKQVDVSVEVWEMLRIMKPSAVNFNHVK